MKKAYSLIPQDSAENTTQELVTVDEARRIGGGESKSSIYRALAAGELQAFKRGRRTLVTLNSIRHRLRTVPKAHFGLSASDEKASSQIGGEQP